MTDLDLSWAAVRTTISRSFGEVPGPQLENEIINAFEQNPAAVIKASEEVAAALHAGEIHSGWPVLRKRIERINEPLRNVTINKPDARAKAIARAEQWLKTAGIHFDRESEVDDELFGDRGTLKDWRDDDALRARILQAWADQRHIGIRLDRQQQVRLGRKRIKANRAARIAKRQNGEPNNLPAELQEPT